MIVTQASRQDYKTGAFPLLPSTSTAQNAPVVQEGLLAYEVGFKLTLAERTLQLNGAVFYYDYKDKQTQGSVVLTPNIFGPLNNLGNIPKSEICGAELQTNWTPLHGLTLGASGRTTGRRILICPSASENGECRASKARPPPSAFSPPTPPCTTPSTPNNT